VRCTLAVGLPPSPRVAVGARGGGAGVADESTHESLSRAIPAAVCARLSDPRHSLPLMTDTSDEEEEKVDNTLLLQKLQSAAHQTCSDDDDDDSDDDHTAEPIGKGSSGKQAMAAPTKTESNDKAGTAAAAVAAVSGGGSGSGANLLPAADVLLDGGGHAEADFLRVEALQPEFDASKHFRPPPVTHAELIGGSDALSKRASHRLDEDAPPQRNDPEANLGGRDGDVRLHGSVCRETADERGRRVVYGAHQMLKADPWSDCNPNRPFQSRASGKRRRAEP
jgi:hypothetical protein